MSRQLPLVVLLALVLVLAATTMYFGRDEYQELSREHGESVDNEAGQDEKVAPGRLRIPSRERETSGIVLAPLAASDASRAVEIFGTVVDLKPLLDARTQYAALSGEIRALRTAVGNLEAEYRRADALYRDDRNVSERVMRQAEADWKGSRDRLAAAGATLSAMIDSTRLTWGRQLADMALNGDSAVFRALVDRREILIQLSVPYEEDEAVATRRVSVSPPGRDRQVPATLVGPASGASAGTTGATYFYRAPSAGFRAGTRVTGFLFAPGSDRAGVVVPESAVVWYAGRAWAYVQDDDEADELVRRPVDASRLVPGGWFNAAGLEAGEQVVVTGAQLLLSEELEYQIRNENED